MKIGLVILNGKGTDANIGGLISHGVALVSVSEAGSRDCDAMLLWMEQPEEHAIASIVAIRTLWRDRVLFAHVQACDEVRAFLLLHGIDDLVDERCGAAELAARFRVAIARRQGKNGAIQIGALTLDRLGRQAWMAGRRLPMMPREFELLAYLAEQSPRVVRRDELRTKLWGRDFDPGTNSVDVHVCRLRRKLEEQGIRNMIYTVRGTGYCVAEPDSIVPKTIVARLISHAGEAVHLT